jgi:hypothetical protein
LHDEAARALQSIVRGINARKEISKLRMMEMEFLGMMRPVKSIDEAKNPLNPILLKEKEAENRRRDREGK